MSLAAVVGTVNDLETRIDAAPLPPLAGNLDLGPLGELIAASGLQAVLHLESGVSPDEPVFISTDAAVAFESEMPWDPDAVRAALTAALRSYQTVGDLGLGWRAVAAGPVTASELDGLLPLVVYADGTTLWIARTPALLGAALSGTPGGAGPGAGTFVARYDHRAELPGYLKTTRMLDLSDPARYSSFFSQNVGSLAAALDTVRSVEVRIDDDGRVQRHIVRYSLTE
jgi:hypothetical protein